MAMSRREGERPPTALVVAVLAAALLTTAAAGVGPALDDDPARRWAGVAALVAVLATQTWALVRSLGPGRAWPAAAATAVALVGSVPLLAPAGTTAGWETWAWVAAGTAGSAPVVLGRWAGSAVAVALVGVSAVVGQVLVDDGAVYALLTAGSAAVLLLVHLLPLQLWTLLVAARAGRGAAAALARADERLRFAADVHDLLGHHLTVVALQAELAARTAHDAPDTAAGHAERARALAATALQEMRRLVHDHRDVHLGTQLSAVAEVLRASDVRCTLEVDPGPEPPAAARAALAAVVREAGTNVLRHSRARWCTIALVRTPDQVELTVTNDGAGSRPADGHSSGLRGLADRVEACGGTLHSGLEGTVFTVHAAVPRP